MAADMVRKAQVVGLPTGYTIQNKQTSLIQLPVLFYPSMVQVRDNGQVIEYGNMGRFIVLQLSQGDHSIDVQFTGISWANMISLLSWVAIIVMCVFLAVEKLFTANN